jgi:hypothetical protein
MIGGNMKTLINILISIFILISLCQAQENEINEDYLIFGRKEPVSPGSMFSALGDEPIFLNPANVAFITDNRIMIGGSNSDLGYSYLLSWTAPNISISSARHKLKLQDSDYKEYQKDLLKFSFAFSNRDMGFNFGNTMISAGLAVKQLADQLFEKDSSDYGGDALSMDLGLQITWKMLTFEWAVLNINAPQLGETDLSYARAMVLGARYKSSSGFIIAFQGISSSTYAGSDLGINVAAQQSFLNHRLVARIQLTSFFSGTEATMQNISASIGYRPVVPEQYSAFQDLELSYAMSFLSMPQTVGTHMLVLTKYF